eukprot:scaffold13.g240.t1
MASTSDEKKQEVPPEGGELLVCGGTDWYSQGRTKDVRPDYPNLYVPHRIRALEGVKVAFVAAGASACHTVIADVNDTCYTWGRNEKGQLGLGDTINRNVPTVVAGLLKNKRVVGGACGKHHTVVFTSGGESYSFGLNGHGQLGNGTVRKIKGGEDVHTTPVQAVVSKCSHVACGAEFTMWLCDGKLWSAGLPQYGQLGHGDDGSYNKADSSVKMVFEPNPVPRIVGALAEKTVTRVACGQNHTIAVCSDGGVWTWGFGGYGRLGHKVQADEWKPRLVETLTGRIKVPEDAIVGAGATATFCTIVGGQLFAWGKLKPSGDNLMYPTPYHDLAGWNIHSLTCGFSTFAVAAKAGTERSTITWGHTNGYAELGYGEGGKKSSANPDKCLALEGVETYQVAMGFGHSLFLVNPDHELVKSAPWWDPATEKDETAPVPGAGGKRKAPAAASGKAKKR